MMTTVAEYGEILGKALDYYSKKYGTPDAGKKLIVVQIDDESLDYYSTQGMMFIANRLFDQRAAPPRNGSSAKLPTSGGD